MSDPPFRGFWLETKGEGHSLGVEYSKSGFEISVRSVKKGRIVASQADNDLDEKWLPHRISGVVWLNLHGEMGYIQKVSCNSVVVCPNYCQLKRALFCQNQRFGTLRFGTLVIFIFLWKFKYIFLSSRYIDSDHFCRNLCCRLKPGSIPRLLLRVVLSYLRGSVFEA